MPVTIDEVSAEITPPPADANVQPAPTMSAPTPEQTARRQLEMLEHLEVRAMRLRAD